tara:strand:+ start:331 stop:645 length:315 start_codon:yes stop_codon:yes gene_type:complete
VAKLYQKKGIWNFKDGFDYGLYRTSSDYIFNFVVERYVGDILVFKKTEQSFEAGRRQGSGKDAILNARIEALQAWNEWLIFKGIPRSDTINPKVWATHTYFECR